MAQAASKRGAMHPQQLRPPPVMTSYDDEPSSMSLELFGYHGGGVVVDGHDADGAAALSLHLAFDDDTFNKHGAAASAGDYYGATWAAYGGSGGASSSSSSSVLSFEHAGNGGHHHHHHLSYGDDGCALWMDAAAGGMVVDHPPAQQHGSAAACRFGLLSPGSSADDDAVGLHIQDLGSVQPPAKTANKRARLDGEVQAAAAKKQCGSGGRKSKGKAAPAPTKDPQSVAAKVRREKIAEKLKVLQDLVPNGTKVDLVTMLEKAITYVKFLQLQVKFWPAQGGKAPELSQVKDALDAILSSQQFPNK
nr:unnamed protein product [Digitaria exilis]